MSGLKGWAALIIGILLCGSVMGQEIKVTTSPNPVRPGGKVRITLQSNVPLTRPAVVVNGNRTPLSKVATTLYTASIPVAATAKSGTIQASIKFVSSGSKELSIPFQFEVSSQAADTRAKSAQNRAGEGGGGMKLETNEASELNIKVDQLEGRMTDLQRQRDQLNSKVQTLNGELAKLKTQKKPDGAVQSKQKEIDKAQEELLKQQKEMDERNDELKAKLNELADRESLIKQREQKVSELESSISASREQLVVQAKSVKLEADRIKSTEATLLKREEDLSKARDELSDKNSDLKTQAEKLQTQQTTLQSMQELAKRREAELAALQKRVGQKSNEVQDLAVNVEKERAAMAQMQQQLQAQRSQVALREKSILDADAKIKKIQNELNAQSTQFEADRLNVQKQEVEVKSRETKITGEEDRLRILKSDMDLRQRKLDAIDSQLKTEKSGIEQLRHKADDREKSLGDKEKELTTIESELTSRNRSLQALHQNLTAEQKAVEAKQLAVVTQREKLRLQEASVNQEKENIRLRNLELKSLNNEIQLGRETFDREMSQKSSLQKADRQALDRRKAELALSEINAAKIKASLDEQASQNATREANMVAMSRSLSSQMAEVETREKTLTETEAKMGQIRKDIFDKYSEMEDLKLWVQRRTSDLQEAYAKAKETRDSGTAQFEAQFSRLEKLTRTLQNRTQNLSQLNQSLALRNTELEVEIRESIPTQSQFSMAWYLGYHSFDSRTGLSDGGQGGLRLIGGFSRDWNAEIGLGIIPTMENQRSRTVLSIDANLKRDLFNIFQGKVYGLAGLAVDMASESSISLQVGIGAKWFLSDDFLTRIDLIKNRDFLALVGFEKRLVLDQPRRVSSVKLVPTANVIPTPGPVVDPITHVELAVSANPVRYQYQFKQVNVTDAASHWASANLVQAVRFGLLSPLVTDNTLVQPNQPLTMVEAARMVAVAVYLPKAIQSLNTAIDYSINDVLGVPYFVDLEVKNSSKTVIRKILSREKRQAGEFNTVWDGRTDANTMAPTGNYQLVLTVFNRAGEQAGQSSTPIQIYEKLNTEFGSTAKGTRFADIPAGYPDQAYINEWVDLGNTSVILRSFDQSLTTTQAKFKPDSPISRLSFIVAVSNAIQKQGVQNYVIADLSPYRDIQGLPLSIRNRLGLYISELNYGGDDQQRLRPFENITRAEAATVIGRFLNWHSKRLGVVIPD